MPQLQNLVLTDRAGTPVNHTFVPRDIVNNVGSVVESSGIPLGDKRVTVGLRRNGNSKFITEFRYTFPVTDTQVINGISSTVVTRIAYATLTFTFDPSSTEQERKDAVGMVQSSLDASKVLTNDMVIKLQGVY